MAAQSTVAVPKFSASFTEAYLQDCYTDFEKLVEVNIQHFDSPEEARQVMTYMCGQVLTSSKQTGIGLIILNMYESKNF